MGVAIKGSIRGRLNWHVNQKHSLASIKSGFSSTFRKSISSLVAGDQFNETDTNLFIDMLNIEYYTLNYLIKSDEAKKEIEKIELSQIKDTTLPINTKGNKNLLVREFLCELKKSRRNAK